METLFASLTLLDLIMALGIAVLAGMIKGLVGFAMPMILVSGLSTIMQPELALAGLILPTLVTNGLQALRQGLPAALSSVRQFRVFLGVGLVFLLASAQLVTAVPAQVFLLMIAVPVVVFAFLQLIGLRLRLSEPSPRIEAMIGAVAGFVGGMSGVWGPPTVAYLTALDTPKADQMRVQGVIYGLGAVALFFSHLGSGILNAQTVPLSLVLVLPAVLGMWVGANFQNRIDQSTFRKATLFVLLVAGLNLLRRALVG